MSPRKKDAYLRMMKAGGGKVSNFPITWGKRVLLFFAHWLSVEYAKKVCALGVQSKLYLG